MSDGGCTGHCRTLYQAPAQTCPALDPERTKKIEEALKTILNKQIEHGEIISAMRVTVDLRLGNGKPGEIPKAIESLQQQFKSFDNRCNWKHDDVAQRFTLAEHRVEEKLSPLQQFVTEYRASEDAVEKIEDKQDKRKSSFWQRAAAIAPYLALAGTIITLLVKGH